MIDIYKISMMLDDSIFYQWVDKSITLDDKFELTLSLSWYSNGEKYSKNVIMNNIIMMEPEFCYKVIDELFEQVRDEIEETLK